MHRFKYKYICVILTDSCMVVCERIRQLTPGQHFAAQFDVSLGFGIAGCLGKTTYMGSEQTEQAGMTE